ncbi:alpha/beta hydrolase family protein, partial [Autumnicola edwardsiae]
IIEKINRPQEPTKPFPYNSEEISFYNDIDKITLAGTLTTPKNKKDFTTAILISGSGPQNRNEEIMNHKPFLIISDYLTRNGIAVLRYDDRGIGESQGEYSKATSKDLSRDTEAAIKYLKSRKDINKNKIGLVGHSEGGLIAPMIASNTNDVSFIVLLAGPGLKGGQLLLLQKKLIEQKSGINDTAVNKSQEIFKGAYEIVSTFKGNDEELRNKLKGYFNEKLNHSMEDSQINSLIENITSPWMKYFIKYDPSSALKKIDIPVLALFGKNDLQVPAVENSKAFQDFGNKNIEIIQLDNLNHLFQESKTGMPNEYSEIEQTISPKVLDIISKWIIELN